ncbi:MAG: exodeoxyribonuclease VII small subunit [Saccharofermentans sp.]|nr:exodeoxyribonuclease VII small subunit [Saccharofermentans sp.]
MATYEEAIEELRKVVATLNEGKVSLDESIKLYQRGIELASLCDKKLKEVEEKVNIINKENGSEDPLNIEGDE